jgi:hypothetical protein
MGMAGSATVSMVGWNREYEARLSPANKIKMLEKISKFYEVAVDVLGLGYMGFNNHETLGGVQLGRVELSAGLSWDVAKPFTVRLSVGGEGEAMVGAAGGGGISTQASLGLQAGVFAKLELILNTLYGHYSVFLTSEYERIDLINRADNPGNPEFHLRVGIHGEW